ncbi:MAG: PIN domain-containing protein [Chloroflexi bacterium]|nr:PIN domain-containing protein [Chloroflexota bacterium]
MYEAADRTASRHGAAAVALRQLFSGKAKLTISDLVLAEVHGLTLGRIGPAQALELTDRIVGSGRVELVSPGVESLHQALDLLRARPGRRISLVDATSFVTMRAAGIETAFTLDEDFAAEGFTTIP